MRNRKTVIVHLLMAAAVLVLLLDTAQAINFSIRPVKIFLDPRSGTEKLYIQNTSDDAFDLQIRAYSWSQDATGKDVYEETSDVLVFPKLLKVAPGEERMIRFGTKQKAGSIERSYRVYIEEIPVAKKSDGAGPAVRMLTRVGVPVFLAPMTAKELGKIDAITLSKGRLTIAVKNEGNIHWQVLKINVTGTSGSPGQKSFAQEISGWYLLSGASRAYAIQIPRASCEALKSIAVEVRSEKFSLRGALDVDKAMCSP